MSVRIAISSDTGSLAQPDSLSVITSLTTSPGAAEIFAFDADDVVTNSAGAVIRVLNALDPSQWLTVKTGADGNPVTIAANSGAKGTSR